MPSRNIPISAMITVTPAKSTARPAVSTAWIAAWLRLQPFVERRCGSG